MTIDRSRRTGGRLETGRQGVRSSILHCDAGVRRAQQADVLPTSGQPTLEHATASLLSNGAAEPAPSFASNSVRRGVGVEDTAAPRSASGRSLTPTPHPERAHMQAKDAKGKINTLLTRLDQPRSLNDL